MESTTCTSWWIWHGVENPSGSDLNEEPMEENDVDDQPMPTIKLPQAPEYAQQVPNLQWSILQSFKF